MKRTLMAGASLAAVMLISSSLIAAELKSGPQVDQGLRAFRPLHCNGPDVGKKVCLV